MQYLTQIFVEFKSMNIYCKTYYCLVQDNFYSDLKHQTRSEIQLSRLAPYRSDLPRKFGLAPVDGTYSEYSIKCDKKYNFSLNAPSIF